MAFRWPRLLCESYWAQLHWRGADCKKINQQFEVKNVTRKIKILPNENILFDILVDLTSSDYPFLDTSTFRKNHSCLLPLDHHLDLDNFSAWDFIERVAGFRSHSWNSYFLIENYFETLTDEKLARDRAQLSMLKQILEQTNPLLKRIYPGTLLGGPGMNEA